MFKLFKRWWNYLTAKLTSSFNEKADPKVQLEQAILEAQEQHRRLKEQAASVIANQKQTEMRLNRSMEELEKVSNNARQAVLMADEATKAGNAAKATELTSAAESFASRLIAIEAEVEDLKSLALQSSQASDQAKAAVQQNSSALQKKLAERQKLLSQLDQAKMQEQMNKAMAQLSETVGEDVPTFEEIRDKIEGRYAKAKGMSELTETSVESRMLEIEQASMNSEAQARLAQIRSQLGLAPAATEAPAAEPAPAAQRRLSQPQPESAPSPHERRQSTPMSMSARRSTLAQPRRAPCAVTAVARRAARAAASVTIDPADPPSPSHAAVPRVRRPLRGAPACGTAHRRTRARRAAPAKRCRERPDSRRQPDLVLEHRCREAPVAEPAQQPRARPGFRAASRSATGRAARRPPLPLDHAQ